VGSLGNCKNKEAWGKVVNDTEHDRNQKLRVLTFRRCGYGAVLA
jgi:hypothetical protein